MIAWISRDTADNALGGEKEVINITGSEPKITEDGIQNFACHKLCGFMHVDDFEEAFGVVPEPGTSEEYEMTLTKIV